MVPKYPSPNRVKCFSHVSFLPSITGFLISMSMVIGQITRLTTRNLYALINSRSSWVSQVEINDEVKGELQFWYSHLPILNGFLIRPKSSSVAFVYFRMQARLDLGVTWYCAVTTKLQETGTTTKGY